ncbi:MAG: hypothetical protein IPK67_20130 [Planctomycetes bacterium]|nr:hypothetical protein [Planctomycetota bacterium]
MTALSELVARMGGRLLPAGTARDAGGTRDAEVLSVCLDSRAVAPGNLFVALPGLSSDGRRFTAQAVERGAVALLSPEPLGASAGPLPNWVHGEARRVAGLAAALLHGDPSRDLFVAAVTGTNGKTSVAHLTSQLLTHAGRVPAVLGTAGNRLADGRWSAASHTTPDAPALQALLARHRDLGGDAVAWSSPVTHSIRSATRDSPWTWRSSPI